MPSDPNPNDRPSTRLLQILGDIAEKLGRAGTRKLEISREGSLTLIMGDGYVETVPASPVEQPARGPAEPDDGHADPDEDVDLDRAHLLDET